MFSFIKNIFKGTLHKACDKGNIEAVKQHLADGADVNTKDKYGWTPLRYAANGHKEIVRLLIAKGADVNAKTLSGWTSLHGAAIDGHKEVAELLIAAGTDVNAKNNNGETPLDWAEDVDEDDSPEDKAAKTVNLLRKHGGKTGEELRAEGK